jgi:predicted esterase
LSKLLKKLKGKPVLMIHGEKDNIISVADPKFAYELLKSSEADIWFVPRSRHLTNKHLKPKEYDERIVAFFDKNIAAKNES